LDVLVELELRAPLNLASLYCREGQFVIHEFLLFLRVFMLSPLKGGSGLKAKRKKSLFQSLGALATRPPHIKKIDRCFWGIVEFESIPHMIPKSNARSCYLKESASFF